MKIKLDTPESPRTTRVAHTPTPWTYHLGRGANPRFHIQTAGGYQIASTTELARHAQAHTENEQREANAAFIVRAVNSHEALVAALHQMVQMVEFLGFPAAPDAMRPKIDRTLADAREALANPHLTKS